MAKPWHEQPDIDLDLQAPPEVRYRIIVGESLLELYHRVNDAMSLGWVPQGGIAVAVVPESPGEDPEVHLVQAMVLPDAESSNEVPNN